MLRHLHLLFIGDACSGQERPRTFLECGVELGFAKFFFCYVGDNSFPDTYRHWSTLRKSWNGDCFDQDQDLLLVEFEKVLVVKKI